VNLFGGAYRNRRVLITGHTGFKGSWLALWLTNLGARMTGVALPPSTTPSHWNLLGLAMADRRLDIRASADLAALVAEGQPEIVFHLAAQPLVRRSYRDPLETWSTNVMGTVNLLDACRHARSLRAIVVVTSDKCYENREWERGYREADQLGGHDPYSASKAATELVAASYRGAFFGARDAPLIATARAGNVIGGGDWSEDRLIPDLVQAIASGTNLEIRSPAATRPWQHVLESLGGYLLLGARMLEGDRRCAQAWNFGSVPEDNCTVADVLARMRGFWPDLAWHVTEQAQPHEAHLLQLDSSKARKVLEWRPVWPLDTALEATVRWYRAFLETGRVESRSQLTDYVASARAAGLRWSLE